MPATIKTIVVAAIIISSSPMSGALARPTFVPIKPIPLIGSCFTDEGQGRVKPCSSGT